MLAWTSSALPSAAAWQPEHRFLGAAASAGGRPLPAVARRTVLHYPRVLADGVAGEVLLSGVAEVLALAQRRVVHLDHEILIARIRLRPAGELCEVVVAEDDRVD